MTDIEIIDHYLDHPDEFIFDCWRDYFIAERGDNPKNWLDSWVIEVLYALLEYNYVAVTGANAIGKTTCECFAKYWFLSTRENSIVPITSVDQPHLRSIVWAESHRWYDRSPELQKAFEHTATRVRHREKPNTWFSEARTARKQSDPGGSGAHAAGLQGFHADHLLFLIDEGSAVDDVNWDSAESSIRKKDHHLMAISNPLRVYGRMFEVFNLEKYHTMWFTKEVSYLESSMVDHELAKKQIAVLGEDSPVAQVRFYGKFPKRGTDDTLPTYEAVMAAVHRTFDANIAVVSFVLDAFKVPGLRINSVYSKEILQTVLSKLELRKAFAYPEFNIDLLMRTEMEYDGVNEIHKSWARMQYDYFYTKPRLGVDLARFGSNKTTFCVRRGMRILELEGFHGLRSTHVKGRIQAYFVKYPDMECAFVDATGIAGGTLIDFIDPELYPCAEVAFGATSSNPIRFYNIATEMWWGIVDNIDQLMLPDNDVMVTQMTTRKYTYAGKLAQQLCVESKKDMAKRRLSSPDEVDSICLTFAPVEMVYSDDEDHHHWEEVEEPDEAGVINWSD